MPESDFRASMLRLRDDARLRIGMLTSLIASIEAIYALPPIVPANTALQPAAEKPRPPRPQSPAPPTTKAAGQALDDKVLQALKVGPRAPIAIREMTGLSEVQLNARLKKLVTMKKIQKIGTGPRNRQYRLTT